ncbi:putative bifunctional diguanylate cyclase/phosphodiesterase, partial [Pseudidiomarina sp.]|uniref:putative bifunctional diguanylate cyclase/phosphodiesterase n=1 Tax=Pseudidiomarina sp. TaxID=2081707 RepID=UPI00299CF7DD
HFDNETSIFLDELTSDIGFALEVYDKERKLEQIGAVFRHSRESIIITEPDGTILDVNPAFTTITGFKREEVLGKNPRILKSGIQERPFYRQIFAQLMKEGYWAGEFWNMRKNGDIYPQRGTISAVRNEQGEIRYFMGVMEDISDHINSENEIQRLVHYDVLTSLPNRVLLRKEFNKIAGTVTEKSPWALFFVDLDHFKHVNDALGHHFGDELLKIVSQRLRNEVTDTDVLCRFGGDEFIVLLKANKDHAAQCAKKMINKVIQPYAIQDQCIHIGCSIGIALMPEHGQTLDELIQAADTAMYEAKAQGRSRFVFYLPEMKNNAQARLKLRTELKQAINESQLYLVYQPKVRITDGGTELFGLEALVRWRQPERGLIMPSEFIPAAEESGQILEIDRWILTRAIKQLALWHGRDNVQSVPLAVNVSAQMFAHNQFIPLLKRELLQSGVPGRLLELEITEYVAMFDIEHTLKTLNGLKELGIQISIDDFGTGHSSLAYLQEFPIDNVKIDISFVREVHNCVKKQGLIRAILSMSNTLGIAVIAEGVEQKEEFEFLKSIGCVQFQGFYFGKPVPGEDVELRK